MYTFIYCHKVINPKVLKFTDYKGHTTISTYAHACTHACILQHGKAKIKVKIRFLSNLIHKVALMSNSSVLWYRYCLFTSQLSQVKSYKA